MPLSIEDQGRRSAERAGRSRHRATAFVTVALALGSLVVVLGISQIDDALGRFSASTTSEGSWLSAGAIDLVTGDGTDDEVARGQLAIDADQVVPGAPVGRCILWTYRGSIENAEVRMYGRSAGGSGLERYLRIRIDIGTGSNPLCADFEADEVVFDGTLAQLEESHAEWADGHVVGDAVDTGDHRTLRMVVEIVSDNDAQGRDAEFWLVLEARA